MAYEKGLGVVQNKEVAYFWYLLAVPNGSDMAVKNRDIIAEELTSSQRDMVQASVKKLFDELSKSQVVAGK